MIVVAAAALPAWLARSRDGRISLALIGVVIGGVVVGLGLSHGLDWLAGIDAKRDRRD
jgi:hypothetical protein